MTAPDHALAFVIAGTDTGVGKTVLAAAISNALSASYWKPVQAGLDGETDSEAVARLARLPPQRILPEAYRLRLPASPHISAAAEGIAIEMDRLALPAVEGPVVIETAGGVLVPLTSTLLQIEMIAAWGLPVIVAARTTLGTINHTLLTLEALAARGIDVHGVAFIGEGADEVERSIVAISGTRRLGRLPWIEPLTPARLHAAFSAGFGSATGMDRAVIP